MIDFQCPRCEADVQPGEDRDVQTCKACGKDYQTVQFGWCFHNIPHPHDCSEYMKTYGSVTLCAMCGGSNEESTRARIEILRQAGPENDLASGLADALDHTLKDG